MAQREQNLKDDLTKKEVKNADLRATIKNLEESLQKKDQDHVEESKRLKLTEHDETVTRCNQLLLHHQKLDEEKEREISELKRVSEMRVECHSCNVAECETSISGTIQCI